jgi:hypothetical protein
MQVPVIGDKFTYTPASASGFTAPKVSSSSKSKKKKKSDEIDRYHEIKESLNDLSREYDAVSKARDRAFGVDKLKEFNKELKLIQQQAA